MAAQMQCTYKDLRKTPSKHLHVAMALQKPPTVYDGGTRWLYLTPDKLLQAHADMQHRKGHRGRGGKDVNSQIETGPVLLPRQCIPRFHVAVPYIID